MRSSSALIAITDDCSPGVGGLWVAMRQEAQEAAERDGMLWQPMTSALLRHATMTGALADRLARKLADEWFGDAALTALINEATTEDATITEAAAADLAATRDRDAACPDLITPFLYYKGYLALQAWRVSHFLWVRGRRHMARHLQSRISEVWALDIHPAARIGRGIMFDHGTGIVVGETAVIEDDVSMLHGVTLGGTGKEHSDRHPKIRRGVLIGAGASVLGNIEVGEGAKIGAGSIVLQDVEPRTTVVGVPARPVGDKLDAFPAWTMDQYVVASP